MLGTGLTLEKEQRKAGWGTGFIPDGNCVLWLPGEPDAGASVIRDWSGKNNHGTIYGATWVMNGQGLWVLSYDGDDKITCASNATLHFITDTTIIAWSKPTTFAQQNPIFSKSNISGQDRFYLTHQVDGTLLAYKESANDGGILIGGGTTSTSYWSFVWLQFGSGGFQVGVDDSVADSDVDTNVLTAGDHYPFEIGSAYNSGIVQAKSAIGLVRAYTSYLSLSKIQSIFHQERHLFGR